MGHLKVPPFGLPALCTVLVTALATQDCDDSFAGLPAPLGAETESYVALVLAQSRCSDLNIC